MDCFWEGRIQGKAIIWDGLMAPCGTMRISLLVQSLIVYLPRCNTSGFPKAGFGECLAMDTFSTAGQWVNIDCGAKLPVACIRNGELPF